MVQFHSFACGYSVFPTPFIIYFSEDLVFIYLFIYLFIYIFAIEINIPFDPLIPFVALK